MAPPFKPSLAEFLEVCRQNRQAAQVRPFVPVWGEATYVPAALLRGNQSRFSWAATQAKFQKMAGDEAKTYIDENSGEWVLKHDEGRAAFKKPIRGLYARGEVYIVDGHHRALISTYLNARTIPVTLLADLSHLDPEVLRSHMEQNGYSHFRDHLGRATEYVDLCAMVDDPGLQLARALIARMDLTFREGQVTYGNVRGREWVIGAKSDEDIPFLEFEIADALRRGGIEWRDEYSTEFTPEQLERFLSILKAERIRDPGSRLNQVLLFDRPARVADLDLHDALTAHLSKLGCAKLLEPRPRESHEVQ